MEAITAADVNPNFREEVAGWMKNYDFSQC